MNGTSKTLPYIIRPAGATGTEGEVCDDIASRQHRGYSKYGKTVSENPLSLKEWLQHAYEEALDQAIYLKRAIQEIDREHAPVGCSGQSERINSIGNPVIAIGPRCSGCPECQPA